MPNILGTLMRLISTSRQLIIALGITSVSIFIVSGCDNTSAPESTREPIIKNSETTSTPDNSSTNDNIDTNNSIDASEQNKVTVTATAGTATATGEVATASSQ